MKAERVGLQFFILLFTINGLHSAYQDKPLSILSQLLEKSSKRNLIVVVNSDKHERILDDETIKRHDDSYAAKIESTNAIYNAFKKAHYFGANVLRTTNVIEDTEEEQMAREKAIKETIIGRCQAVVRCTEMCSETEEEIPEPKRYCQKSCKAVFDHLIKCPPPGNKKNNY